MSTTPSSTTEAVGQGMLPIRSLSATQRTQLLTAAASIIADAVAGRSTTANEILGPMSNSLVMGAFVTLKRNGLLRGCCGVVGKTTSLAAAITQAATRTAREDQRMAPISPIEIPYLDIDVTLLGPFKPIPGKPSERVNHVKVGLHGLMIQSGKQSGLLLPAVAQEQGWTAKEFLQAVCRKAGLSIGAWEHAENQVMTFEGEAISGELSSLLADKLPAARSTPINLQQLAQLTQFAAQNIAAITAGATPSYYAPNLPDMSVNAIVLSMQWASQPVATGSEPAQPSDIQMGNAIQVSFRPGIPLQTTLFQMCQSAAQLFQRQHFNGNLQVGLTLGFDPCMHGYGAEADLQGIDTAARAIVVSDPRHCAFAFDPNQSAQQLLSVLRDNLPVGSRDVAVHSVLAISTMPKVINVSSPTPVVAEGVRPPAVAGRFYPAEDAARRELVNSLLKGPQPEQSNPLAIMVPHAGLKYSGRIAGEVWRMVKDLDKKVAIIISPKHTGAGVNWAVSPHQRWRLSEGTVFESDAALTKMLAERVSSLKLDAMAHHQEHGIEVQLPLLEKLAPHVKVVGLALSGGNWQDIQKAARELADILRSLDEQPLLVISSDMNHYAPDAETRRLDRLALDAMCSDDPEHLLETCRKNNISMCGVIPAALVIETLKQLGHQLVFSEVDYATSGDVSGDRSQVVGYAGLLISASE